MALSENSNDMVMPVAPMYGNGMNGMGYGDGGYFMWFLMLILFAFCGGNWGGFGNGGNAPAYQVNNDLQRGFDQQSVMNGINGVQTSVSNGFANAEVSRCNNQANTMLALNNLASDFQQCCCENKQQIADLKYTVATEAANTRAASQSGNQMIMDKLCQLELDGVKQNYEGQIRGMQNQIDALNSALNNANTRSFVGSEVIRLLSDNANQTAILKEDLNPRPVPAYPVHGFGCNCGNNFFNASGCCA